MTTPNVIVLISTALIALKAITVGSDFSFRNWIKDGRKYLDWYNNRETYTEYRSRLFQEAIKRSKP